MNYLNSLSGVKKISNENISSYLSLIVHNLKYISSDRSINENEIRSLMPMLYYHVWDNYPYPTFNKVFYDSNDKIITISKVTDDIYSDAQGVLPRLQDYIEGYVPMMFKRETLDLMMDGLKTINQKKQILLDKFSKKYEGTLLDNLDDDFPPDFLKEFNDELNTILKTFSHMMQMKFQNWQSKPC